MVNEDDDEVGEENEVDEDEESDEDEADEEGVPDLEKFYVLLPYAERVYTRPPKLLKTREAVPPLMTSLRRKERREETERISLKHKKNVIAST